jgi:uncharacterized membrane protein
VDRMELLRDASLIFSTAGMGLMAGVFGIYTNAIMPGLRATDDRTFVTGFQSIDRAIINPTFMTAFLGTLIATGVAIGVHAPADHRAPLPWIVVAFVLYFAVVVITIAVNVPLNDAMKAAGHPDDVAALRGIRERFHEVRWVRWNGIRSVMTIGAFGCLLAALLQHGADRYPS